MQERIFAYYQSPLSLRSTLAKVCNYLGLGNVLIEEIIEYDGKVSAKMLLSEEALQKVKSWKEGQ